jgi:hypothetical protein
LNGFKIPGTKFWKPVLTRAKKHGWSCDYFLYKKKIITADYLLHPCKIAQN